ncbi:hypothetical protein [Curtobacterium sp. 20TX0008]|uniref:hypothetical protein n=1 Tax=Curtobacterium sp. 20TX0008 TaxID=3022018 RepID=UPI0023311F0D|nr:hypothetical protein [Curtobacterium sp. 20TX0008]MDB6427461.1 hypothetical protein [Curtobacterium sp. 20TX0008]
MKLEQAGLWIRHPDRYWFAGREDVQWGENPATGRWDEHPIRWDLVAAAARPLTEAFRLGQWRGYDSSDDTAELAVAFDVTQLTTDERRTVASLFWSANAITADPWASELDNGRHRAWGIWSVDPSIILPVECGTLGYYASYQEEDDPAGIAACAAIAKEGLPCTAPQILDRSVRCTKALRTLAAL